MKKRQFKVGDKIIVRGDDCWNGDKRGEILEIVSKKRTSFNILVRVTEEFWITEATIERDPDA